MRYTINVLKNQDEFLEVSLEYPQGASFSFDEQLLHLVEQAFFEEQNIPAIEVSGGDRYSLAFTADSEALLIEFAKRIIEIAPDLIKEDRPRDIAAGTKFTIVAKVWKDLIGAELAQSELESAATITDRFWYLIGVVGLTEATEHFRAELDERSDKPESPEYQATIEALRSFVINRPDKPRTDPWVEIWRNA